MKITSISYKKIFPIAQYVNETIGVEMQVDEGDDASYVFEEAKNQVEWWHTLIIANPYVQKKSETIDPPHVDEGEFETIFSYTIKLIKDATTFEELAKLKYSLPKELMPLYMKRMKELTPKSI